MSPSRLDSWQTCGYAYYRRYVLGDVRPPRVIMLRGSGVHDGAEHNFKQKIESKSDLPAKEIIDVAVAGYEQRLQDEGCQLTPEQQSRGKKIVLSETKDTVAALADLYVREQAPYYQPVLVEKYFRVELPNSSHDLSGIIDLFDDQYQVRDFKTAGKSKTANDVGTSLQLQTYSVAIYQMTGALPANTGLDVLIETPAGKRSRQLLTVEHDVDDISVMVHRVNAVLDAISKGVFPPAPTGHWKCSARWCEYAATDSCPYYNPARDADRAKYEV